MFFNSKKNKTNPWDGMFSSVSDFEISLAKKMVFFTAYFIDNLKTSGIISTMTNGQYYESIAFIKTFYYHAITVSPTVHNLFYGFLFEMHKNYYEENNSVAMSSVYHIRISEHWYLDSYLESNNNISTVIDRYYRSMIRTSNSDPTTNISLSRDDFSQSLGPILESLHCLFLSK